MSTIKWGRNAVISVLTFFAVVFGPIVVSSVSTGDIFKSDDATTPPAAQTAGIQVPQVIVAGASCDIVTATMAAVESGGFNLDEYTLNEADFDLSLPGANEVGEFAFAGEPVVTKAQMEEALASTSDEAFNTMVLTVSEWANTPEETVRQSIDRWVNIQYMGETVALANTGYRDGEVVDAGERQNKNGEVLWIYVPEAACEIVREAINEDNQIVFTQEFKDTVAEAVVPVRGACLNPQGGMYQKPPPPATPSAHQPAQPGQPSQPAQPDKPERPERPDKPDKPMPCTDPGPNPPGDGKYGWTYDPATCEYTYFKVPQTRDEMQNGNTGVRQDPQDNQTAEEAGANTGPTTDGDGNQVQEPPAQPATPNNNRPSDGQPAEVAPDPTGEDDPVGPSTGTNSGSSDGSGSPSGSLEDPVSEVTVGDNNTSPAEDSGQGGGTDENNTDEGGFD